MQCASVTRSGRQCHRPARWWVTIIIPQAVAMRRESPACSQHANAKSLSGLPVREMVSADG